MRAISPATSAQQFSSITIEIVRPRALVVSDYAWPTGGTEEYVRALLIETATRYRVELLTWASSQAPVPAGVKVTKIDHGDVLPIWAAIAHADVVVIVTSFNIRLLAHAAYEAVARSAVPVLTVVQTSAHSSPEAAACGQQAQWLRGLVFRSDLVVGASSAVVAGLRALLKVDRTTAPTIKTIENGARFEDSTPGRRGRRQVLFIGRPTESKGYPVFLGLVGDLTSDGLVIAANTVSVPPAETDARVDYSQCLTDAALKDLFRRTDLIVAPYRRADGMPLALLEALNCGVPMIGFDSPAVAPLLHRHGQHVVPQDPAKLLCAIRKWRQGELTWRPPARGNSAKPSRSGAPVCRRDRPPYRSCASAKSACRR